MSRSKAESFRHSRASRGLRSRVAVGALAAALSAACTGSAQAQTLAHAPAGPIQSVAESRYSIDLLGPDGRELPTFRQGGRYYVLGEAGDRYTVRVRNPTRRRVEAVVSVDGLDAIDGETADYRDKRGYVVPARGEVRVDGFRVSQRAVAAFRFSSVSGSYAGRKGMPRNVGVVGVAIFEEARRHPQALAERDRNGRPVPPRSHRHDRSSAEDAAPPPRSRRAPSADGDAPATSGAIRGRAESESGAAPRGDEAHARSRCCGDHGHGRPGLGTGFGERRHAPVTWTRFVRANPERPSAVAELRYNDAPGLAALGIDVAPSPDRHEVYKRETASPFPFARPPGH